MGVDESAGEQIKATKIQDKVEGDKHIPRACQSGKTVTDGKCHKGEEDGIGEMVKQRQDFVMGHHQIGKKRGCGSIVVGSENHFGGEGVANDDILVFIQFFYLCAYTLLLSMLQHKRLKCLLLRIGTPNGEFFQESL